MNHAVGGILPAVSVFRESCYRHIVLYHCEEFYKLKYCSTVVYMVPRA